MASVINEPTAFESIQATVADTAVNLVTFGFTAADLKRAARAYIFVNSNALRLDWSGNTPTTAQGVLLDSTLLTNHFFVLDGNENINQLLLIRDAAASAEVFVILA